MFTGIVEAVGRVTQVEQARGKSLRVWIQTPWSTREGAPEKNSLGDSIAVNGVCLTIVAVQDAVYAFDVSPETLRVTALGDLSVKARVNLERALRVGDRLGGHWVLGHVDGLARVSTVENVGDCYRVALALPPSLARYVVEKGSITVHGVSLTVNAVSHPAEEGSDEGSEDGTTEMVLMIIPHTWKNTHFCGIQVGDQQHIEVDILAKHVERLMPTQTSTRTEKTAQ